MLRSLIDRGLQSQFAAALAVGLLSLATVATLTRLLGPDSYALLGIVLAASSLALILQDGGYRILLFRELGAPEPGSALESSLMRSATGWSLIATVLLLTGAAGWSLAANSAIALVFAFAVVESLGKAWNGFVSSAARAGGAFRREAWMQVRRQIAVSAAAIAAALLWSNVIAVLLAMIAARMLVQALPDERRPLAAPQPAMPAWWLMMIGMLTVAYVRADLLVLGLLFGADAEVGIYAAVSRLIDMYVFALSPLAAVFFQMVRTKPQSAKTMELVRLCALLALPGLIALAATLAAGEQLIVLAFGRPFASGARYLPLLAAATVLLPANFLIGQILLAWDYERTFAGLVFCALILKLGIVMIFAAQWGAMACAAAVLATELFLLIGGTATLVRIRASRRQ
jgi:O-antigen/teichoic acid export membrane protein